MNRRRIALSLSAIALLAVSVRHPTADIQVLTHDAGDAAPHRVQAAVDLGLVGVKLLVTWTAGRLR